VGRCHRIFCRGSVKREESNIERYWHPFPNAFPSRGDGHGIFESTLGFPPEHIVEPVIYNIGRQHKVVTNIRHASVATEATWFVLELSGDAHEIEQAMDHLSDLKVECELVEGDVVQ